MRRPFIFTSLGVVRCESNRGNRKCGPENIMFKWHQTFGSEEDLKRFTIYGQGCHLGHVVF